MPKKCSKCGSEDFVPNGKSVRCRPCKTLDCKLRYERDKTRILAKQAEWYQGNKEEVRATQKTYEQTDAYKLRKAKWAKDNKGICNANGSKRRAALLRRTPGWADHEAIKKFYIEAEDMEVDHIVPLQGRLVSGLHCEDNLQLLTIHDNRSKGNRYAS